MTPPARKPWSPEDIAWLREQTARGIDATVIARELKRDVSAIQNKRHRLGLRLTSTARSGAAPADPTTIWRELRDTATREAAAKSDAFEWLRPVALTPPPRVPVSSAPNPCVIVAGDFHFGMHDDRAIAILVATVEALRPRMVVLNGDTVDLLAVSRWPKDMRAGKTWTLRDEVTAFHGLLHTLHSVGDAWGMRVIETSANHSGNGTDGRWWRYLNDKCPELLQHADAETRLSYQSWFFPAWSNIELVDSVTLGGDSLLVLHGDIIRGEGGYTAKASREKWMHSVIVNHVHRVGMSAKTITALAHKPTSYVVGYENGCLCKLEVPYGRALNWQQGFAIVTEGEDTFGVEQVLINNGVATVAALGRTVRA